MTDTIVPRDHIRTTARACAEAGGTVHDCPWPEGTAAREHFERDFYEAQRELVAEVEG